MILSLLSIVFTHVASVPINTIILCNMYGIVSTSIFPPMQLASEAGAAVSMTESEKKRLEQLLCDSAELEVYCYWLVML